MIKISNYTKYVISIVSLLLFTSTVIYGDPIEQTSISTENIESINADTDWEDELNIWEAAGISEDEIPENEWLFQENVDESETDGALEETPVPNEKTDNVTVSVILSDEILNSENNYAYAVHIDFDNMDEENSEELDNEPGTFTEGDYGIETERLTVMQDDGYVVSGCIGPGDRLVTVTIPGDYKALYSYTINGVDIKEIEFAGEIIKYPIINTKNKTYNIDIEIYRRKDSIDYLDSDELLPDNLDLDKILSGEYGESRAQEIEEILSNTPENNVDNSNQNNILIFAIIILVLLSGVGIIIYIRYRVNNDD